MPFDTARSGVQHDLDALIDEQVLDRCCDVGIFAVRQLLAVFDHGDIRSESTKRLRKFEADITAAEHNQMSRQAIEFQRLDMRHWRSLGEAGHVGNCVARANIGEHAISRERLRAAVAKLDFDSARSNESRDIHN